VSTYTVPTRQSLGGVLRDLVARVRRLEGIPPRAVFEIKLFPDAIWGSISQVVVGDDRFVLAIDVDLDGAALLNVQAFVTTSGSSATEVMVRNISTGDNDMLLTPVTIASGDFNSDCGGAADIDPDHQRVDACNLIALDVDAAGTGAKGLGVILTFGGF
jgi:hypothetical protein